MNRRVVRLFLSSVLAFFLIVGAVPAAATPTGSTGSADPEVKFEFQTTYRGNFDVPYSIQRTAALPDDDGKGFELSCFSLFCTITGDAKVSLGAGFWANVEADIGCFFVCIGGLEIDYPDDPPFYDPNVIQVFVAGVGIGWLGDGLAVGPEWALGSVFLGPQT